MDSLMQKFRYMRLEAIDTFDEIEKLCDDWISSSSDKTLSLTPLHSQSFAIDIGILQRCGPFLTSLDVNFADDEQIREVMQTIADYCPTVRVLKLRNMNISGTAMEPLAEMCNQLEDLEIERVTGNFEDTLGKLLAKNTHLKTFSVRRCEQFKGVCLSSIQSPYFQKLNVEICEKFDLKQMTNSKHLCKSLESLSLTQYNIVRDLTIISNRNLTNLRVLELKLRNDRALINQDLRKIVHACPLLTKFIVTIGSRVNERTLDVIFDLPQLDTLRLEKDNCRYELWSERNREIPNLKKMELINFGPTDVAIIKFIRLAPKLEYLRIDDSGLDFEDDLFEILAEVVAERSNKLKLQLECDDMIIEFCDGTYEILDE